MKRKVTSVLIFIAAITAPVWLMMGQTDAYFTTKDCNWTFGTVCGYFKGSTQENSNCNVLPGPNWCHSGDTSNLNGVNSAGAFMSVIQTYLRDNGSGGWDINARIGAAFIVDTMLGGAATDYNKGTGAGVSDARNNISTWNNMVMAYSNESSCSNATTIKCSGASFGINWAYTPPQTGIGGFCPSSGYGFNTGYDQFNDDVAIYPVSSNNSVNFNKCKTAFNDMKPEIVFWWNGGANTFAIGTKCGNVVQSATPPNKSPTGTISVTCDQNTGYQNAFVTFGDADGPTTAYITVNGWSPGNVASGSTTQLPQSNAPPFTAETVTLSVKDSGPTGSGYQNFSASTSVPCATVGCNISVPTPNPLDPFTRFSVSVNATNNVNQTPPGAQVQLFITPPAGASFTYTSPPQSVSGGSTATATFSGIGPTNKTGLYITRAVLTVPGMTSQACNGTMPVMYLPYLNVYGGDVMTGSSPSYNSGVSSCSIDNNAGVFSWNNHSTDFSGAGSQYAVRTLAAIVDFASGLDPSNTPPTHLSFANTYTPADPAKLNPGAGLFGGFFGAGSNDCDFTSDITQAPANADMTLPATVVPNGANKVYYVSNHDVYISGNIMYSTAGWTDVSQIPSFKLVVTGGDIYIDHSVTQLDGLYVAESAGSAGGRIFTCATGLQAPVDPTLPNTYATCNKQLVINGAFVARYVAFGRTYGSLGQAKITDSLSSNHDAEVFNYTPELWLPRNASSSGGTYDAITGLPPVL